MKNKTLLSLIAATGLSLLGCAPSITEGTVYEKYHEEERTYVQIMFIPIIQSKGKSTFTKFIPIPYWVHDDEDFVVEIKNYDEKEKERHRTLYLSKEEWNKVKIGDYLRLDPKEEYNDFSEKRKATSEEQSKYDVLPADKK